MLVNLKIVYKTHLISEFKTNKKGTVFYPHNILYNNILTRQFLFKTE